MNERLGTTTHWTDLGLNVLAVSLVRSNDRRERFATRMLAAGIDFEFVDAVDGDNEALLRSSYVCDAETAVTVYDHRERTLSGREIACTLSHMRAVREAHIRGFDYALICEDDLEMGQVTAAEFAGIIEQMPADAGYVQLCVTPERSMRRLADYYLETGRMFACKSMETPIRLQDPYFDGFSVHCATAYIVTSAGAAALTHRHFIDDKIVFNCREETIDTNAGLLADRYVYRACTNQSTRGYVHCIPTVTYEALDSLLHPDHLGGHLETKRAAQDMRAIVGRR